MKACLTGFLPPTCEKDAAPGKSAGALREATGIEDSLADGLDESCGLLNTSLDCGVALVLATDAVACEGVAALAAIDGVVFQSIGASTDCFATVADEAVGIICLPPSLRASSRANFLSSSIFFLSYSSSAAVFCDCSLRAFSFSARAASLARRAASASSCFRFCSSMSALSSFSFCSRAIFWRMASASVADAFASWL